LLSAAETALQVAQGNGAGTIRAFSADMAPRDDMPGIRELDLATALEADHIQPWFQPQVSTETGEITGMEALARWTPPGQRHRLPKDFLPEIENAGLTERLTETILYSSLKALADWDKAGFHVPRVSINVTTEDLRNPKLVDKVRWELDRFDLGPDRLVIEILESVIANTGEDMIPRNLLALSELGCRIDLDDFGTGHASVAGIRQFHVDRIKIDRSFVTHVDKDPKQREMIDAMVTLAGQLNVDVLAEGVETMGEHTVLAQLGCGTVQGFVIARPMPEDEVIDWLQRYDQKLGQTSRETGTTLRKIAGGGTM
jgi:EAL domain-containing protein (putative c-di-GMP-specific phosphodiesterase class I)